MRKSRLACGLLKLLLEALLFATVRESVNGTKYAESPSVHDSESEKRLLTVDQSGYILYCPCMGRFGNQAEQFIGALAFSKAVNRTLVLPPWVVYPISNPGRAATIPFDEWFRVEPLTAYHRVMTMEMFMEKLAPVVWPPGKRIGFCYSMRAKDHCAMKEGSPFGPFWDHFHVEFDSHQNHSNMLYDADPKHASLWQSTFPADRFPVLAFAGVPGSFPSQQRDHGLHEYIHFSSHIEKLAVDYISQTIKSKKFIAIHLRNGFDMVRACDHVKEGMKSFFASYQCTGYWQERPLSYDMCNPPEATVLDLVKRTLIKEQAHALFVSTDNDPMIFQFENHLRELEVKVYKRPSVDEFDDPLVDIAILTKADVFIGNCVSSFSAFVMRQRTVIGKPVRYFSVD